MNENEKIMSFCDDVIHAIEEKLGKDVHLFILGTPNGIELHYMNEHTFSFNISLKANNTLIFDYFYSDLQDFDGYLETDIFLPNFKTVIYVFSILQYKKQYPIFPMKLLHGDLND